MTTDEGQDAQDIRARTSTVLGIPSAGNYRGPGRDRTDGELCALGSGARRQWTIPAAEREEKDGKTFRDLKQIDL